MEEFELVRALDARLISSAQAVEGHYEITRYGTLKTWAVELGMKKQPNCSNRRCGRKRSTTDTALSSPAQARANVKAKSKAA